MPRERSERGPSTDPHRPLQPLTRSTVLAPLAALAAATPLPRTPQSPHVGRVAQLLEGPLADLADALAGDAEQRADLLQGERLGAFLEPVVEREDLRSRGVRWRSKSRSMNSRGAGCRSAPRCRPGRCRPPARRRCWRRGPAARPARRARPRCEIIRRAGADVLDRVVERGGDLLRRWARGPAPGRGSSASWPSSRGPNSG